MTTTITVNLTQADLQLLLVATTKLLTYCTAQKRNGNDYAAQSIPDLVEMNHQLVLRLQILKGRTIYNQPTELAPRCRDGMPLDAPPAAQETEIR